MSRVHRIRRRRASDPSATHKRAQGLAAEQLGGTLQPADGIWLAEHLSDCATCRSVAAAYEADRLGLRAMRDQRPEPPRDLWARTSVAIEREAGARGGAPRRAPGRRSGPRPALGVMSGIAVIAVVIGASALSGGFFRGPTTAVVPAVSTPPVAIATSAATPGPTPIAVGAGAVGWVGTSENGALAYNVAAVDEVCPRERQPDCAPVTGGDPRRVELDIRPKSISQSPIHDQAVVVGTDAAGDDAVLVVSLPTAEPTATPPPPSTEPSGTPTSTDVPATPGTTPEPTSSTPPAPTPAPTIAVNLAIVSGVKIVGHSASYSPDGAWFAFTARPSDDSAGPDIYVWRVGDELARPMTNDHASVFGSWVANRVLGSRPATTPTAAEEVPALSFLLDPATGEETAIAGAVWRPVVDPYGRWAILWDGTVQIGPDGVTSLPASGSLVLREFSADGGEVAAGSGTVVADRPVSEYDAHWDETGTWVAIWMADASDPAIGRLSLLRVDPVSGRIDRPDGAPQDVTSMPGFSIANGRLAWVTPRGQGGEGSRVQIVAWTDETVGAVESGPVEDVVVVH
jgi:hypothetical protein